MTKMELIESDTLMAIMDRLDSMDRKLSAVDMTPRSKWLSIPEYAVKVNKSADTVRRWIRDGLVETKTAGHKRLVMFNPSA